MQRGVLIAVVIGILVLGGVLVYANQQQYLNLTEIFGLRGDVVAYGTYMPEDERSQQFFEEMESTYQLNYANGIKTYFVYGDAETMHVATFTPQEAGTVNLVLGENTQTFKLEEDQYSVRQLRPSSSSIDIIIEEETYSFDVGSGETIYFIVTQPLEA